MQLLLNLDWIFELAVKGAEKEYVGPEAIAKLDDIRIVKERIFAVLKPISEIVMVERKELVSKLMIDLADKSFPKPPLFAHFSDDGKATFTPNPHQAAVNGQIKKHFAAEDESGKWRTLNEFPAYEMNREGLVRHRHSKTVKKFSTSNKSYYFYIDGQTFCRTRKQLLQKTFPAAFEAEQAKFWRPCKEAPSYEVSTLGKVRIKGSNSFLTPRRGRVRVVLENGSVKYLFAEALRRTAFGGHKSTKKVA